MPERGASLGRLGLRAFTAKSESLIPGQGTKIPQASQCSKNRTKHKQTNNKKNKKGRNRFSRT